MTLLMIPGPIALSDAVKNALLDAPLGHQDPTLIDAFGRSIEMMRSVWLAGPDAQPFVIAGSGTLAMEIAALNLMQAGDRAVLVRTGFFSDRMVEMLQRCGVEVDVVGGELGCLPRLEVVDAALAKGARALFVTHVDTSTALRADARALAQLARKHGALSIFDGVCATAAERFEMQAWDADVYFTASQKAIGLPPGLALLVLGPRAMEARRAKRIAPPLSMDVLAWQPIMRAYEAREPSYFATPATSLVRALPVSLSEILEHGMDARFDLHARTALAMRAGWGALGLRSLTREVEQTANTLSALYYPEGVGPELLPKVRELGVAIAGGVLADLKTRYFRVGHMGWVTTQPEQLRKTLRAVAQGLIASGHSCDVGRALAAFDDVY